MSKIDPLVKEFLAQKKIAVVGVSDKRETGSNAAYRKFKDAGYTVNAINPHLETFEGDPCYPDLAALGGTHRVGFKGYLKFNRSRNCRAKKEKRNLLTDAIQRI